MFIIVQEVFGILAMLGITSGLTQTAFAGKILRIITKSLDLLRLCDYYNREFLYKVGGKMALTRRSLTKALLVLAAIIAILVCAYFVARSLETGNVEEPRGTLDESFISYKRIEVEGKRYIQNNQLNKLAKLLAAKDL